MRDKVVLFWFRRDLRLEDNAGLSQALASGYPVLPLFIFDTDILDQLDDKYDRRVHYIHQALNDIKTTLETNHQSTLYTFQGKPSEVFASLYQTYSIQGVYCNKDYEPQARTRDQVIEAFLRKQNITFYQTKDQVIFEPSEIVKMDNTPYTVYTPYAKKWLFLLKKEHYKAYVMATENFYKTQAIPLLSLKQIGFEKTDMVFTEPVLAAGIIKDYDQYRDYPAKQHTSQLGTALRFGTISIRKCVAYANTNNAVWLSELIWREFFMQILYHFPNVVNEPFKKPYSFIKWRNDPDEFQRWCQGKTGFPIVDAGMRQLNQTGYMHNRVRMVVASFLCKHLLIDWRWGEAYFAQKLNDFDLSANNGNWQWAAGCGCDAAPYFRIFNPTTQTQKFDKDLEYIKKWNPDYELVLEPPVVQHEFARARALKVYKEALQSNS